jgi:hypothetical protein
VQYVPHFFLLERCSDMAAWLDVREEERIKEKKKKKRFHSE